MDRCRQIILSAFKQSRRLFIPELHSVIHLSDYIYQCKDKAGQKFIADCSTDEIPYLGVVYKPGMESIILIGPEGDFTKEEISLAVANDFKCISLGGSTLRVETAGITACNIIQCSKENQISSHI